MAIQVPECSDAIDNDFDGALDVLADPGCESPRDPSERASGAIACDDGLDNDGDGQFDFSDSGCSSPGDGSERSLDLVCDNGVDDDGDGTVDFPADPDPLGQVTPAS